MLDELNKRLVEIEQRKRESERAYRALQASKATLERERQLLDAIHKEMQREKKDVDALEGLSLTGLFHTVLGNKDVQLEKERQEFLRAKLRYDEALFAVKRLEQDVADLEKTSASLSGLEEEYQQLLKEKEEHLIRSQGGEHSELFNVSQQLGQIQSQRREVGEAILAGETALRHIDAIKKSLDSAAGWGVWDMVGGGLLSTAIKHSHIDKAKQQVLAAQHAFRSFARELKDVDVQLELDLSIDGFLSFADYFFDGLIMDWMVQSKIRNSQQATEDQRINVINVLHRLRTEHERLGKEEQSLAKRRQQYLE